MVVMVSMADPSVQTPEQAQQDIVAMFEQCADWDARYKTIIQLGRELPEFPEAHRTDQNKVKGCQSQVWMHVEKEGDRLAIYADSDAMIVRGLLALVLKVYNHQLPEVILETEPTFLDEIQLTQNLSMQRNNGLAAVLKQIKMYAYVLKLQG